MPPLLHCHVDPWSDDRTTPNPVGITHSSVAAAALAPAPRALRALTAWMRLRPHGTYWLPGNDVHHMGNT
jgi:hypothetical protein